MKIFTQFPDPARDYAPGSEFSRAFGREPLLFAAQVSREVVKPHWAPFSLKAVLTGREHYVFDRRRIGVGAGQLLVMPGDVVYGSEVPASCDAFSLYLPGDMVAQVVAGLSHEDPDAVSAKARSSRVPWLSDFVPVAEDPSPQVWTLVEQAWSSARRGDADDVADVTLLLLEEAVRRASALRAAALSGPAAKPSVRRELFRRTCIARGYIEENLGKPVGLNEIAKESGLSAFHLHRTFRTFFGETPRQYQLRRRMKVALDLTLNTDLSVERIGEAIGYGDPSAFIRRFSAEFGLPPGRLRGKPDLAPEPELTGPGLEDRR